MDRKDQKMNVKTKSPLSCVQSFTADTDFVWLTLEVVEVSGSTVGEYLSHLIEQFPGIQKRSFGETDSLLENIVITVYGESIHLEQLVKPVKDWDEFNVVIIGGG